MNNDIHQVAVIAPQQMLGALEVLIRSASHLNMIGAAPSFSDLLNSLGDAIPDVILHYVGLENDHASDKVIYRKIHQVKSTWPDAIVISIVKYKSQQEKAIQAGAHTALVEGISAERLLAALEGNPA